jgi:hypothetical protein
MFASTDLLTAQIISLCCIPDRLPSMVLSISRRATRTLNESDRRRYGTRRQAETTITRRGRSSTRLALMSRRPLIQPQIWQYQRINYFWWTSSGPARTLALAQGSAEYKTSIILGLRSTTVGCRISDRCTYPWCRKRTILP